MWSWSVLMSRNHFILVLKKIGQQQKITMKTLSAKFCNIYLRKFEK
jgi:hypothetical protein